MTTQSYDELINELSELCGIVNEYYDIFGNKHITSVETKKAVLRAMRLSVDAPDELHRAIEEHRIRPWKDFTESVKVFSVNDQPFTISVYIPVEEEKQNSLILTCSIESEEGRREEFTLSGTDISPSEQRWIDNKRYIRLNIKDTKIRDIGYYQLNLICEHLEHILGEAGRLQKSAKIIIAPDTCYMPSKLQDGREWGLSINLYSIRSHRNWGIGDFTDLKELILWASGIGAGYIGLNPLHAIFNTTPFGISPYSPISRLYRNFIYLDVEDVPDVKSSVKAQELLESDAFNKELNIFREKALIDYEGAALPKERLLRIAFDDFYEKDFLKETQRGRDFKSYLSSEDSGLESFAAFCALWRHMRDERGVYSWQEWPEEYRRYNSGAVQRFKNENEKEILFYQYLQWLIESQLMELACLCKEKGMSIGIYNDLAIGSIAGGSDGWAYQDIFGTADVGAPPDDFSPNGQNWGFPPLIPEMLKDAGYKLFIKTIRNNMKYSGALRIDHALGLFRLFWIPTGMAVSDGAYLTYPSEDLLRIIALESVRNKSIVIAEDLGTIGENVRDSLKRFHMLSYRLFYFERNYPDPSFTAPGNYPVTALCSVTTHDLPTLYGYWAGQDIKVRKEIGGYPDDEMWRKQLSERERDKGLILSALKSCNILSDDFTLAPEAVLQMIPELCIAIYQYLAKTPCKLTLISLDDIIGTLNQQNMPGTVDTYPNWIQKTPMFLEDIVKDIRFVKLSEMFRGYFNKG